MRLTLRAIEEHIVPRILNVVVLALTLDPPRDIAAGRRAGIGGGGGDGHGGVVDRILFLRRLLSRDDGVHGSCSGRCTSR